MKNTITELGKRTNSALQAKLAENYKLRTDLEKYCVLITVNSHNVPHHIIIVLNHIFLFFLSLIFKYSHISADIVCVYVCLYGCDLSFYKQLQSFPAFVWPFLV